MTHTGPFGPQALASISPRERRTVIGHASIDLMSPISSRTLDELIAQIPAGARLLDMGCGKAALARALLRRDSAASAVCVERNRVLATQGEALAKRDGIAGRLQMIVADGREWKASEPFDAIALLGATHAIGSLQDVLAYGRANLKPRGIVLLGEGVWASRPDPEYLSFLGADESEMVSQEALVQDLEQAGFAIYYKHLSTVDEWDAYEGPYVQSLKEYADASGSRPFAEEADAFEDMQAKHGRKCMGFVVMAATWETA